MIVDNLAEQVERKIRDWGALGPNQCGCASRLPDCALCTVVKEARDLALALLAERAALRSAHAARVTELLEANNREVERRRRAERGAIPWVIVPREPTEAMAQAAPERPGQETEESMYHGIWRAMVAAAPKAGA
jgi:hypothetical protein